MTMRPRMNLLLLVLNHLPMENYWVILVPKQMFIGVSNLYLFVLNLHLSMSNLHLFWSNMHHFKCSCGQWSDLQYCGFIRSFFRQIVWHRKPCKDKYHNHKEYVTSLFLMLTKCLGLFFHSDYPKAWRLKP